MFDFDLAELYKVETRIINRAVRKNLDRFPSDFMFILNKEEFNLWKSQILISQNGISSWGGRRKMPFVFTEQGVAMLSSVLKSKIVVQVNIAIMRVFTKLREILLTHKELKEKIEKMEQVFQFKFKKQDQKIQSIFMAIKQLIQEDERPKVEMGFRG